MFHVAIRKRSVGEAEYVPKRSTIRGQFSSSVNQLLENLCGDGLALASNGDVNVRMSLEEPSAMFLVFRHTWTTDDHDGARTTRFDAPRYLEVLRLTPQVVRAEHDSWPMRGHRCR